MSSCSIPTYMVPTFILKVLIFKYWLYTHVKSNPYMQCNIKSFNYYKIKGAVANVVLVSQDQHKCNIYFNSLEIYSQQHPKLLFRSQPHPMFDVQTKTVLDSILHLNDSFFSGNKFSTILLFIRRQCMNNTLIK